jgi:hypothetical protein
MYLFTTSNIKSLTYNVTSPCGMVRRNTKTRYLRNVRCEIDLRAIFAGPTFVAGTHTSTTNPIQSAIEIVIAGR